VRRHQTLRSFASDPRGFTLIEMLIVAAIVGILASVAVAAHTYGRIRGGEVAAVAALGAINQAQFAYRETCGNHRYFAPTLVSLGVPVPGGGAYLSPDLTQADPLTKTGYVIRLTGSEVPEEPPMCTGAVAVSGYQLTADPLARGTTGARFFATNADRVIFEDDRSLAGEMPETGAPPRGHEIK
jgi:prepilin-type N-terminal cleavage/methylation domain-containing protein